MYNNTFVHSGVCFSGQNGSFSKLVSRTAAGSRKPRPFFSSSRHRHRHTAPNATTPTVRFTQQYATPRFCTFRFWAERRGRISRDARFFVHTYIYFFYHYNSWGRGTLRRHKLKRPQWGDRQGCCTPQIWRCEFGFFVKFRAQHCWHCK